MYKGQVIFLKKDTRTLRYIRRLLVYKDTHRGYYSISTHRKGKKSQVSGSDMRYQNGIEGINIGKNHCVVG